jgi:hypothetical protein
VADRHRNERARRRAEARAPRGAGAAPPAEESPERDGWASVLSVVIWIGLFMGIWAGLDALFRGAPGALSGVPALRGGANALASAREVVAPILALLLASYAVVLYGVVQRWIRGEPSPCQQPDPTPPPRSGVPQALREESAIAQVERELGRARRAERSGVKRAALAVNDRLMLGALRRRGYNDNVGCGGIVLILLAATVALPFAAEAAGRLVGLEIAGPLAAALWFALAYGGFAVRWLWMHLRHLRSAGAEGAKGA